MTDYRKALKAFYLLFVEVIVVVVVTAVVVVIVCWCVFIYLCLHLFVCMMKSPRSRLNGHQWRRN